MIVVDASAILELLLRTPVADRLAERLLDPDESMQAPHLLDLEVARVLRRYRVAGSLGGDRAGEALDDFRLLRIHRHSHEPLLSRVWELRHDLTAYDAAYVALAEALGAPLVTRDARLAARRATPPWSSSSDAPAAATRAWWVGPAPMFAANLAKPSSPRPPLSILSVIVAPPRQPFEPMLPLRCTALSAPVSSVAAGSGRGPVPPCGGGPDRLPEAVAGLQPTTIQPAA